MRRRSIGKAAIGNLFGSRINHQLQRSYTMKKTFSLILAALFVCMTLIPAFAADGIKAVVTICDGVSDMPALACADVAVTDKDADGALTIYDALYCAHEQYYTDGAAGFGTSTTDYGLSLTKLWGNANGYGFGYYVNDVSAWSLTDPVKEGDYIAAFVYKDTTYWSDAYSYFDVKTVNAAKGENVTVYLTKLAWVSAPTDEDPYAGSMQASPAAGAVILLDGRDTGIKTGTDGKFAVTFYETGTHIISAKATDGSILVPPACRVNVPEHLTFFQKFMQFVRNIIEKLKALFTFKK